MNVKYMDEIPMSVRTRNGSKDSKMLELLLVFIERPERIMEIAWEESHKTASAAVTSARRMIILHKLALRVTCRKNRVFIKKEVSDAE